MSASTATISSISVYTTPAFWNGCGGQPASNPSFAFIVAYIVYAISRRLAHRPTHWQPLRRRSLADSVRGRVLRLGPHLMWFRGGAQDDPGDAGKKDGWGAAATASSPPSERFPLLIAMVAALAYSSAAREITCSHRAERLSYGLACVDSFPRECLSWPRRFGLWRARLISNALFAVGVAAVVLVLLGGTPG